MDIIERLFSVWAPISINLSHFTERDAPLERVPESLWHTLEPAESRCVDDPRTLPPRHERYRWTLVLDLDETLICARDSKNITVRPYSRIFLEFIRKLGTVEMILWSAGIQVHVDRCLTLLDSDRTIFDHAICRGASWMDPCTLTTKNVAHLQSREGSCILIDDSYSASFCSGARVLIVPPFNHEITNDPTLLYLIQIVLFINDNISPDGPTPSHSLMDKCGNRRCNGASIKRKMMDSIRSSIHRKRDSKGEDSIFGSSQYGTVPAMYDESPAARALRAHPFVCQVEHQMQLERVRMVALGMSDLAELVNRMLKFIEDHIDMKLSDGLREELSREGRNRVFPKPVPPLFIEVKRVPIDSVESGAMSDESECLI